MLDQNILAYEAILHVSSELKRGKHQSDWLESEKTHFRRYTKGKIIHLRFWTDAITMSVCAVANVFLIVWIVLLINEIFLFSTQCGDWWRSTCLNSDSQCKFDGIVADCRDDYCAAE
jgi:hypothetical protein